MPHCTNTVGQARPDDTDCSGAEIRSCCRLAALLDVLLAQAAWQVVPVAVRAAQQLSNCEPGCGSLAQGPEGTAKVFRNWAAQPSSGVNSMIWSSRHRDKGSCGPTA